MAVTAVPTEIAGNRTPVMVLQCSQHFFQKNALWEMCQLSLAGPESLHWVPAALKSSPTAQ